ncbi:hypothetical protein DAPPUDRAFT_256304 [Daphnia pulex]|uniref:Uncharacterized protein n=1 Tax=Daphnia pulex TaxID=6669 RepID=E9HB26_DAPPU|nr:hypothetical protein DAPPUDRAFT_256304 [Daphnia pulex]|eukprot:EFX71008.1 hypothetical protein DAPPUDRAFT_256304 [Daphnia pulex]
MQTPCSLLHLVAAASECTHNTLSILQRTLSSPTPSEAGSPKVLTENPLVELPTGLYPSLTAGPADQLSISLIFAQAEDCLTQVDSDSDSDESETELGKEVVSILNKPDESTEQTENQLFTEPGVRGGRSVRPRTSTRIQIVSDDSIPDNLVEIEKCSSELSNNEEGNTASRVQIVGSSNEAGARIPLSPSPVIPYNSQPCPSGHGENPSYHYASILRQDFINAQYARATAAVPSKFEFLYKQRDSGAHCDNILPGGSESFRPICEQQEGGIPFYQLPRHLFSRTDTSRAPSPTVHRADREPLSESRKAIYNPDPEDDRLYSRAVDAWRGISSCTFAHPPSTEVYRTEPGPSSAHFGGDTSCFNRPTSHSAKTISDRAAHVTVGFDFTTSADIPAHRHTSASVANSGNDSGTSDKERNSVHIPISTELPSRTANIPGGIRVNTDAQSSSNGRSEPPEGPDINRPYKLGEQSGNRKEEPGIREKVTTGAPISRGTPAPFPSSSNTPVATQSTPSRQYLDRCPCRSLGLYSSIRLGQ